MKNGFMALAAAYALGCGPAFADSAPAADPPLVVNGDVRLTTSDFIAYANGIPEEHRTEFLSSADKISKTVDGLWVRRMLAEKARRAGLADDPEVQARIRQAADSILADRYMEREVMGKIVLPDLEKRALEIYRTQPERFTTGETVRVQHIVVGLRGRTREMALQRAREAYQEATAGSKDFLALAKLYSDDPDLDRNGGSLGDRPPGSFTLPAWQKIDKMKVGEVSEPLETERGFQIFRLVDRKAAVVRPFEQVKDKIIATEAQKFVEGKREEAIGAVLTDPSIAVHRDNIEKLQVEVNLKSLPRVESKRP